MENKGDERNSLRTILRKDDEGDERNSLRTILGKENKGDERNSIGITVPPEHISSSTCLILYVERIRLLVVGSSLVGALVSTSVCVCIY